MASVDSADVWSSCLPGDVTGFTPVWHRPTAYHTAACSSVDQRAFEAVATCVEAGGADCLSAAGLSTACSQCLATPDTASRYGPILLHSGWAELNMAGCLAYAMKDPTGVKCAAAVQAASGCELDACGANCPVSAKNSLATYQSCARRADDGPCAGYSRDAACASMLVEDAGADVALCLSAQGADVAAWFAWFCSAPADDAGAATDSGAPADAASD